MTFVDLTSLLSRFKSSLLLPFLLPSLLPIPYPPSSLSLTPLLFPFLHRPYSLTGNTVSPGLCIYKIHFCTALSSSLHSIIFLQCAAICYIRSTLYFIIVQRTIFHIRALETDDYALVIKGQPIYIRLIRCCIIFFYTSLHYTYAVQNSTL